jgi:peptidyl-prolyl cis-trans isomerase SurA
MTDHFQNIKRLSPKGIILMVWLLIVWIYTGWFAGASITQGAELVDRIVAIVNDDIISLYELNMRLKPYADRIKNLGYPIEKEREMLYKVRKDLLDQLIDQKLTDQEAKRAGIGISEKEIDTAIERIKESQMLTDEVLREQLSREGLSMEAYRNLLKEQIVRQRLVNLEIKSKIVVTQEDIKDYYERNKDRYGGENQYRLKHLYAKVPSYETEVEKNKIFETMKAVREKLNRGEEVDTILSEYGNTSPPVQGGDLGSFKLSELSAQIRKELAGLKKGQSTRVMETKFGYQIVIIDDIEATPGKSLEKATPEIQEKLYQEVINKKFQSWLGDLRKRSHIKFIQ